VKLLRVLGIGEIVMLVFVALATITLLAYLNNALQHQPAVITPVSTQPARSTQGP